MPAPTNPNRRTDIAAALKRAKPADMLALGALATVWGVSKPRFVSVMPSIVGMPEPTQQGQAHIYPAKAALQAMLRHETRHDDAARDRETRTNAILGGLRETRTEAATGGAIPARDLQILNRLATEIEQRERDQRQYIPAAEVARVAGDVFSELSEFIAGLSNAMDPNGLLDPNLRALIDSNGAAALLGFHKRMKDILDADVIAGSPGRAPGRAGKPRARRKRA